jgi:NitT/TauT family transport system ATP-binding protein
VNGDDGPQAAVAASGLTIGYGRPGGAAFRVLSGIDLNVARGEFLTILGPSGCGKSTLLRVIADLAAPLEGRLEVMGRTPSEARRRREVAFVFQDATLLPWRTVLQNVLLPLQVGRRRARQASAESGALLEMVGLSHLADRYPHQLSGGQRQRVAIARAFQCEPDILLMDEPFGALDEITRERLNDELLALWQRMDTTILFVTHSVMEAVYLGNRVLVLASDPGRVQGLVDLAPAKDANGHCQRDDPAALSVVAHLRQMLHKGARAA